ncbi:MAG: helix-turn-helix protein [Hyperionvirus sp.]|uniref:Helix-turn-helix protein n=1 Tax=Hyperionvirus sp. TaxID=2487770 RepID=A0A3G5ABT0_9VIRU|nr:MAG: helix-turn-helix protein [Hyperionvirus sp.]
MTNKSDFEPTFLTRKPTKAELKKEGLITPQLKFQSGKNTQKKTDLDLRKVENEEIKLTKMPRELAISMQQARNSKKLTQEKLAQQCGLSKDVIINYENCKAIVKQHELDKINKALGTHLKKPKQQKQVTPD